MAHLLVAMSLLVLGPAYAAMKQEQAHDGRLLVSHDAVWCGDSVKSAFTRASTVLKSNPAGILSRPRRVGLRDSDGKQCLYRRNTAKHFLQLLIDQDFEDIAACCSLEERLGIGTDDKGKMLPFSADAFASLDVKKTCGLDHLQVKPDACPAGGCPLVVELPGNGGEPWLMVRNFCASCHRKLGVVIVSPVFGPFESTSLNWITSKFIPFVRAYVTHHSAIVDKERVYLVSASRGNEIALAAALAAPDIWSFALMTGKFKFTAGIWHLVRTKGIFQKSKRAGLQKIEFHIGDVDPIVPDEEFYANFSGFMNWISKSKKSAPKVSLHVYPGQAHGTGPGIWSKRSPVIWSGIAAP